MAEAYTLSQEQSDILEKVLSFIVKEEGESFSSEELGIIKHIISPDDFEIIRRYMGLKRDDSKSNYAFHVFFDYGRDAALMHQNEDPPSLWFSYKAMMGAIGNIFQHSLFGGKSCQRESWVEARWKPRTEGDNDNEAVSQENFQESKDKIEGSLRSTEALGFNSNIRQAVYELYWEMISKCASGMDDAHEVSSALFDLVDNYDWVAQVVLIVAAFAMSFGEFWVTVEPFARDPLSQSICLLKRPDCLVEVTDSVKFGLESLRILVERIWDLTNLFVDFEDPITRFGHWCPEVYLAGYQVVYSAVLCLSHNMALVRMNKEYTTLATEVQQMTSSSERLAYLHSYLKTRTEDYFNYSMYCAGGGDSYQYIEDFLRQMLSRTKQLFLGHHSSPKKVKLKEFKRNFIALLVSDFRVQKEEFSSLVKTYKALEENDPAKSFEVVWVPIMPDIESTTWTADNNRTGASMPWYWVWDPSSYTNEFVEKRVKKEWKFQGKPILVIYDRFSRLLHTNALPVLELWGPSASPFTALGESKLKEGLTHAINFMFSAKEPNMEIWAEEGKIICFYGSHNEDWITTFLHKIESITVQTSFEMEITYVGTNKIPRDELARTLSVIKDINNKSRTWSEEGILSLWQDLKKMTSPKMQTNAHFSTRKELVNIFNYDEYEDGWALIFGNFREEEEIVKASGTRLIDCLGRFRTWGSGIQGRKDFLREFNKDLEVLMHATQHCSKGMKIPTAVDGPIWEHCVECGRFMIN